MPGVECRIDGQLWCRHPAGFQGYVDERGALIPRETDEWFPTRDRAEWHEGEWLRAYRQVLVDAAGSVDGLPIGLQVIGRHYTEQLLLDLALAAERNRPWPLVAPGSPV